MTTGVVRVIRNVPASMVFALALVLLTPLVAGATSCTSSPGSCFSTGGGTATDGALFSSTLTSSTVVLNSSPACKNNCSFSLTGPISGTPEASITVSGATRKLLLKSKTGLYNEAVISLVEIPEPSTLVLMGTGLLGMGLIVRRRTRLGN